MKAGQMKVGQTRALLDVNVFIALIDDCHPHHELAQRWAAQHTQGFATCPLVQNGVLRIMANPKYNSLNSTNPFDYPSLFTTLKNSLNEVDHAFWSDNLSLLDANYFQHDNIHSHKQLTDIYLLGLAVEHGGCLVTFDRHIALSQVRGASPAHVVVLR